MIIDIPAKAKLWKIAAFDPAALMIRDRLSRDTRRPDQPAPPRLPTHGQDRAFCMRNDFVRNRYRKMGGFRPETVGTMHSEYDQVRIPVFRNFQDLLRDRPLLHDELRHAPQFGPRGTRSCKRRSEGSICFSGRIRSPGFSSGTTHPRAPRFAWNSCARDMA